MMSLREQLNEIAQFDYITGGYYVSGCAAVFYEFGWKDGLRFYLDDYFEDGERERRYILVVWSNKKMKSRCDFSKVELLIEKIKEFINESQSH